jgi:hypothetical protein
MNKITTIDFSELGMPVFSGRPRGEKARAKFQLDSLPSDHEVIVIIPDDVYTVTSSYFLGLFGPSVRRLGSREAFLDSFEFRAPAHIHSKLDDWITRALREKGPLMR